MLSKEMKETKEIEETQEMEDLKEECLSSARGAEAPSRDGQMELSPEDEARALVLAQRLAGEEGGLDVWTDHFDLARALHTVSDQGPDPFEKVVRTYCELTGHDFDEFWLYFLGGWDKVRLGEGDDRLKWALRQAQAHPVDNLRPERARLGPYRTLASMAYHLSQVRRGQSFQLPICDRLASLLTLSKMTIGRTLDVLMGDRVIRLVDGKYNPRTGKARKFAWQAVVEVTFWA
jgi:hypothetical protein